MSKNVYFHIDELARDAITASALRKAFQERGMNLVYGNRVFTQKVLEHFAFAFDIIILPRTMFLRTFKNLNKNLPAIVIVFTESVGRVVQENNERFTLSSLLDKAFMQGDTRFVEKTTSFCLWGEIGKSRIIKHYPEFADKLHVVGHPRFDKRCFRARINNNNNTKAKIGLITKQGMLNDFLKRSPVDQIVNWYSSLEEQSYTYNNKSTGDFLLRQNNEPVDQVYIEAADLKIMLALIFKLNEKGHEVYLKVHPREDREFWEDFVKKNNLNVTLAHWLTPFSHWVKDLDYVIGPASTSFYDCCAAGVQPICTRKIDKNRDFHIKNFAEENNDLMKHIVSPETIDEIIEIVSKKNYNFELNDELKNILLNETNYPNSKNSIDKIVDVSISSIKKNKISPFMKNLYMIGFILYGNYIVNLKIKISRFINKVDEQGSTFLMNKKNRKYIDSLVD